MYALIIVKRVCCQEPQDLEEASLRSFDHFLRNGYAAYERNMLGITRIKRVDSHPPRCSHPLSPFPRVLLVKRNGITPIHPGHLPALVVREPRTVRGDNLIADHARPVRGLAAFELSVQKFEPVLLGIGMRRQIRPTKKVLVIRGFILTDYLDTLRAGDIDIVALRCLGRGRENRRIEPRPFIVFRAGIRNSYDCAVFFVIVPGRTTKVPAKHEFNRLHLQAPHNKRARDRYRSTETHKATYRGLFRMQVMWKILEHLCEPEVCERGEHIAFARNECPEPEVENADLVRGDHQQPVPPSRIRDRKHIAHFARVDEFESCFLQFRAPGFSNDDLRFDYIHRVFPRPKNKLPLREPRAFFKNEAPPRGCLSCSLCLNPAINARLRVIKKGCTRAAAQILTYISKPRL